MSKVSKRNKKKDKKKRLHLQVVFWVVSTAFLLACILFYGGRLIYYYDVYNSSKEQKIDSFYQTILNDNYDRDTLSNVDGNYYFKSEGANNYVEYSNMLFRIVKLNKDNSVMLVADKVVTNLAMGESNSYSESYIYEWLNRTSKDDTGIFLKSLNNVEEYLVKSEVCLDVVDEVGSNECINGNKDNYVILLSMADYINTGNVDSFINNGQYFYLSDSDSNHNSWYVNSSGKVGTGDGSDIYGIRPVITLNSNVEVLSGDGSSSNPYKFERTIGLVGSYVKLDEDIWRIYEVDGDKYKLVLNDYLKVGSENLSYNYSKDTYEYDDSGYGSLAYYLNNTYYNSLSYKDIIISSEFANGYYEKKDYKDTISTKIKTKVGIPSVGDIVFNSGLSDYFMATGNMEDGKMIYVVRDNGRFVTKSIGSTAYVVPCISINRNSISGGDGSLSNPYGME